MTQFLREDLLQALLVALALATCPPGAHRQRVWVPRLRLAAAGTLLTLLLAMGCAWLAGRPAAGGAFPFSILLKQFPVLHLAVGWWFYAGAWQPWQRNRRLLSRLELTYASLLQGLLSWSFCTALASFDPDRSFRLFVTEIAIYIPFVLCWMIELDPRTEFVRVRRRMVQWARMGLAVGLMAAFTVAVFYAWAAPKERALFEQIKLYGTELIQVDRSPDLLLALEPTVRLAFPFNHHNRLAYFALAGTLIFAWLALARRKTGPQQRIAPALMAVLGMIVLAGTLNRGGALALLLGGAILVVSIWNWRGLLLLPPLALAFMFQSAPIAQRMWTVVRPDTYEAATSTVTYRLHHWNTALAMLKAHPVLGIGYGWDHFQRYYLRFTVEHNMRRDKMVHAHNIWLQAGAETGLPGLILFVGCAAMRWWLLTRLLRRKEQLTPGQWHLLCFWIALEVALQTYCMINLPLRRSLGLLTWGLWMLMFADLLRLGRAAGINALCPRPD